MANSSKQTIMGMLFITLGQFLWNTNDAILKLVISKMSLLQILLAEHICGLLFSIIWWKCKQPEKTRNWYGDPPFITNIWMRSFFHFFMAASYFWAVPLIPLGDASCILYYCPLLIIFTAHVFLKEKLPNIWILIIATISTISGIVLLYQPTFIMKFLVTPQQIPPPLNIYGVYAIVLSGISWTFACILIRQAKDSHVLQLEMVNSVQSIFLWIPLLCILNRYIFHNNIIGDIFDDDIRTLDIYSIGILFIIGILGYGGVLCMTVGYQLGDATKVSWLEYIVIIFSFCYQIILFRNMPTVYQIIGAVLVLIGCLLPVLEEIYNYHQHNSYSQGNISDISSTDGEDPLSEMEGIQNDDVHAVN